MAFYTSRDYFSSKDADASGRSLTELSVGSAPQLNNSPKFNQVTSRSCDFSNRIKYIGSMDCFSLTLDDTDSSSLSCDFSSETQKYEYVDTAACSDIVPPLDLRSESDTNSHKTDRSTATLDQCESSKLVLKPDLDFRSWLSAKNKVLSKEMIRRKKAEERKREEQMARKRRADEKFKEWLESKSSQHLRSVEQLKSNNNKAFERKFRTEQEIKEKLEKWERAKQLEIERRRMVQKEKEELDLKIQNQRRQMANEAWQKWLAQAAKKPKPVPLNRGIITLRGTISDIFINPNEWQFID